MAEKVFTQEIGLGLQDLEKEITCAICHEHYTDPKVLPCCHYYCKQCIYLLAQRKGLDKPFSCPECRADTTLSQEGVDSLHSASFINRMKDIHFKLELAHGKVEAKCEVCSLDKAEAFCRQCAQFICVECVKSHQRLKKLFPGHEILSREELKKSGPLDIAIKEAAKTCELHDQPMNVYCFDCKALICLYCSIKAHNGHNHESVKVAISDTKKKLLEKVETLSTTRGSALSQAIKIVQATKSSVTSQEKSEAKKIEASFSKLVQLIEVHKKDLLAEVKKNSTKKLERLSSQEESLSIQHGAVQSVIEYTKHCVKHSSDDEIMSKHGEMHDRLDEELKKKETLDPVEEADTDVEVNCAEDLCLLLKTKAKVQEQLALQCSVDGKVEEDKCQVAIIFSNGQPKVKKADIDCEGVNISQVNQVEAGKYFISYNSAHCQGTLNINVQGCKVQGGSIVLPNAVLEDLPVAVLPELVGPMEPVSPRAFQSGNISFESRPYPIRPSMPSIIPEPGYGQIQPLDQSHVYSYNQLSYQNLLSYQSQFFSQSPPSYQSQSKPVAGTNVTHQYQSQRK